MLSDFVLFVLVGPGFSAGLLFDSAEMGVSASLFNVSVTESVIVAVFGSALSVAAVVWAVSFSFSSFLPVSVAEDCLIFDLITFSVVGILRLSSFFLSLIDPFLRNIR